VSKDFIGQKIILCGWVDVKRHHGQIIFINLRDISGTIQIVINPHTPIFEKAESLKSEYVVRVTGTVQMRPKGNEDRDIATGEVEVEAHLLEILNVSKPLPFSLSEHAGVTEDTRLKYRYLDLRRPKIARNLLLRSRLAHAVRRYLQSLNFVEIETPILTKSTPEGARDYLVPSRENPGKFYALPQSPQMFKQILMVAGFDRYFQLSRNFRDEDLRSDRQPEHTQIDMEMSFADETDIFAVVEGLVREVFAVCGEEVPEKFKVLKYSDAMLKYGTDKPDLRFDFEILDCTDIFETSAFKIFRKAAAEGGRVLAIKGEKGGHLSRSEIDKISETSQEFGFKQIAWMKFRGGNFESPIAKFLSKSEKESLKERFAMCENDILFLAAGEKFTAASALGKVRTALITSPK